MTRSRSNWPTGTTATCRPRPSTPSAGTRPGGPDRATWRSKPRSRSRLPSRNCWRPSRNAPSAAATPALTPLGRRPTFFLLRRLPRTPGPMDDAIRKAEALVEALGYVRTFRDRLTVIKLGGSAIEDPAALRATLQSVVLLETVGIRPVLVHGGGKPIDRAMAASGLTPKKIQGRRYTDDATLNIVVDVLTNEVNAGIVRQMRELGGRAVGLHSGTLQALHGERLALPNPGGEPVDLGRVGQVTRVDAGLIRDFADAGVVPVIPSLACDADGGWLNVNADTAACSVA